MKLFDKRPLCLILCILLVVFIFFANFYTQIGIFVAVGTSLLIFIFTFVLPKIFRGSLGVIRVISLFIIPTVIFPVIYFKEYFEADRRFGAATVTVSGYIHEIDKASSTKTDTAIIKTTDIDGEPMSRYTLIAYFTKEESVNLTPGAEFTLTATVLPVPNSSYFGRGISGMLTDISNIKLTAYRELSLTNIITDYRQRLTRYIVQKSEDTYAGGLFAALFVGERDYLEPGLSLNFRMIGISHVLALSGMHLAIICMGLGKILEFLGVGRKARSVSVILFTLLYMAFTGFSSSVTRSGLMLILSLLLYLLSSTHDSTTSLFLSVALIILAEPYAIYDVSLWLSAFATLGVLTAYEAYSKYDKNKPLPIRALDFILISFISTLFAITATALISHVCFGRASLIAPISALVFGILSELYMYIGFIALALSLFVGGVRLLSLPYLMISELSGFLSDIDHVYSYTTFTASEILIGVLTVSFVLFLILNIKHRRAMLLLFAVLLFSLYTASYFMTANAVRDEALIYKSESGSDTFIAICGGKVAVVDSKDYRKACAYSTLADLQDCHITKIDLYILPSYYWYEPEMLEALFEGIKVEKVLIPTPQNETEKAIKDAALEICQSFGVKLEAVGYDSVNKMENFSFIPVFEKPSGEGDAEYVYVMRLGERFCTYVSSGVMEGAYISEAAKVFLGTSAIVFGSHGQSYSEDTEFSYEVAEIQKIIFNSTNYSLDGYVKEFYENAGVDILYSQTSVRIFD